MEQLLTQIADNFRPIIQQEVRTALTEFKTRIKAPKDEKLYSRKENATKCLSKIQSKSKKDIDLQKQLLDFIIRIFQNFLLTILGELFSKFIDPFL
jgi:hypothetical protein